MTTCVRIIGVTTQKPHPRGMTHRHDGAAPAQFHFQFFVRTVLVPGRGPSRSSGGTKWNMKVVMSQPLSQDV